MNIEHVDETQLNALLDGELAPEDEAWVLAQMELQPELKAQYENLAQCKRWLKVAYASEGRDAETPSTGKNRRWPASMASLAASVAVLAFLLGLFLGQLWPAADEGNAIMLHLDSNQPQDLAEAMETLEALVARSGTRVELVANSNGLDLLREDRSPYAEKIRQLMQQYPQLRFIACSNAIKRMQERGETVRLIPGTIEGETAVDHIVRRMKEGWEYERI